ncbi:MAG: hypothetical protein V2B18_02735, partial [Pseudomonadota bacterium]
LEADRIVLTLSLDELGNMGNALGQVCSGFYVKDFVTKMGAKEDKVRPILRHYINPVRDRMDEFGFQRVSVRLSGWELRAIIGALQEVCRGLGFDFSTRMGVKRSEIHQMIEELGAIYDQMQRQRALEETPPAAEQDYLFRVEEVVVGGDGGTSAGAGALDQFRHACKWPPSAPIYGGAMELKLLEADRIVLTLSLDELGNMGNALYEVCHGISVKEFATKMGAEYDKVRPILVDYIAPVYRRMKKSGFGGVSVRLSGWELRAIIGAQQEVCRELGFDFPIRMRAERCEIKRMIEDLDAIYDLVQRQRALEGTPPAAEQDYLFRVEEVFVDEDDETSAGAGALDQFRYALSKWPPSAPIYGGAMESFAGGGEIWMMESQSEDEDEDYDDTIKNVAVYKREKKICVMPLSEVRWRNTLTCIDATPPVIVIEEDEPASRKGSAVREALAHSKMRVRRGAYRPAMKAVGLGAYSGLKNALCCDVCLDGSRLGFIPFKSRIPRRGYVPIWYQETFLPADASDEEVGIYLEKAFDVCEDEDRKIPRDPDETIKDAAAKPSPFQQIFLDSLTAKGYDPEQALKEWNYLVDHKDPQEIALVTLGLRTRSLLEAYGFATDKEFERSDADIKYLASGIAVMLEARQGGPEYARSKAKYAKAAEAEYAQAAKAEADGQMWAAAAAKAEAAGRMRAAEEARERWADCKRRVARETWVARLWREVENSLYRAAGDSDPIGRGPGT